MTRYRQENTVETVSLHDCRAYDVTEDKNIISFSFDKDNGFYVTAENELNTFSKPACTGEASLELVFGERCRPENNINVYYYESTDDPDRDIRVKVPLSRLTDDIKNGAELEFITKLDAYMQTYLVCWLWKKTEPYHIECDIEIFDCDIYYVWNELFVTGGD